ncbi:MAG: DTW domain-containing protein [bacterium]|nr:DTW domain-containing protein [bacterium]
MTREMCYRCFLPQHLCWCGTAIPMPTRTRFVILMHPKEFKHEKAGTGRLTHLCLANSEIRMGTCFDEHQAVQALIRDPLNLPVLLYPGEAALNVSKGELSPQDLGGRRLVVFLLDATWSCARKMLKLSPTLQALPRLMFSSNTSSRFVIKQQPQAGCLSTLEATHELLLALEKAGLDEYALPEQMLGLFARMQQFHLDCARDPSRDGYRRSGGYSDPASRRRPKGASGLRRSRYIKVPAGSAPAQPQAAPPEPGDDS